MRRIATLSSPTSIQRISQNDVTERGITDMGDAMRRFSGVNLRDYGGAGGLKTVCVRGMGAQHTVVTYDGLPVSDIRQGQIDMGQFNVDRLSGIELQTLDNQNLLCPVRSIAAAVVGLYGLSSNHADRKWHGSASLKQASFSTYSPSVMIEKQVAKHTAFSLSQDYFYALNNYPFTIENGVATTHLRRNNSKMQTATSEASVRITPNDKGEISLKAFFMHNYRHLPGMVRFYVNQNNERLRSKRLLLKPFGGNNFRTLSSLPPLNTTGKKASTTTSMHNILVVPCANTIGNAKVMPRLVPQPNCANLCNWHIPPTMPMPRSTATK